MAQRSQKGSALNFVFIFFIVTAVLLAGATGRMQAITDESFAAAKGAVTLAIGLIGIMALWLGLTRVLEAGGLMFTIAEAGRPLMRRLFPDVPPTHPAMSAMLLNLSANLLGLGNAATPFGIKAMFELNKLNRLKGTATNAMCLFLAINTSSITLLPLGTIGVRAAAGASRPADIVLPTLIATTASTVAAVLAALLFAARDWRYRQEVEQAPASADAGDMSGPDAADRPNYDHLRVPATPKHALIGFSILAAFAGALAYRVFTLLQPVPATKALEAVQTVLPEITRMVSMARLWPFFSQELLSYWLMPGLMLLILVYGVWHGVKVYEAVTEGAKQGFDVAVRIIPFLVAILVAIGMFRASGAMEILQTLVSPVSGLIGIPAEALPMALVRPLSGSGAFALMSEIINRGPDSYASFVASTIMGCTETTFYVLAVYFGAVGVSRVRHALWCGLIADIAGMVTAGLVCRALWVG